MATVIPATKARNRFFDLLDSVIYEGEEFIIEKAGAGKVRIVPEEKEPTPEQVDKILADVRKVFAKSKKRKYWSVLDTPAWKKKETKYLEDLYKRVNRTDLLSKNK